MKRILKPLSLLFFYFVSIAAYAQAPNLDVTGPRHLDIEVSTTGNGAIEAESAFTLSAAPNPANSFSVITIKGVRGSCTVSSGRWEVMRYTRQLPELYPVKTLSLHIDLEKVETGVYIIEATSGGKTERIPLHVIK